MHFIFRRSALIFSVVAIAACCARAEEPFRPGEKIEYKVGGTWPPAWELGIIVEPTPSGKQYIIRRKPTQFFPQGDTIAYAPEELRRPQPAKPPANDPGAPPNNPAPNAVAVPLPPNSAPLEKPAAPPPVADSKGPPAPLGEGLLSKDQIVARARQLMGGDPWGNPKREAVLAEIRDWIKAHGTNFYMEDDFRAQMDKQGTMSSHIGWAANENHGPAPKLGDYFGKWALTAANRGSHSVQNNGGGTVTITTTDSQAKSGELEIREDGTYVWMVLPGDPPERWLKGKWRECKPAEMNAWEGGPALWLEHAKQDLQYMVRMDRTPGRPGWINVGAGPGRTPVEFGKKK